jgi:hypothetical protein
MGLDLSAAVETDVVEPTNLVFRDTDDENREAGHVVDLMVSDLGNLLLPASHLPGLLPNLLHLEIVKSLGGVLLAGNPVRRNIGGGLQSQDVRNRLGIRIQKFLVREPGRPLPGVPGARARFG